MNLFQEAQPSFVSVKGDAFSIDGISRNALQVLIQQIQPIRKFFQDGKLICYSMDAKISRSAKTYCAFCGTRHKCSPKLRISMIWLRDLEPIVLDLNRPSFTNLEEFVDTCLDDLDVTPVTLKIVYDEHDRRLIEFIEETPA